MQNIISIFRNLSYYINSILKLFVLIPLLINFGQSKK